MKENLETVRLVLHIYMAICATVIAFTLSNSDQERYRKAQQDLEYLRSLNANDYVDYVRSCVDSDVNLQSFLSPMAQAVTEAQVDFKVPPKIRTSDFIPYGSERLPSDGVLEDIYSFFKKDESILVLKLDAVLLQKKMKEVLRRDESEPPWLSITANRLYISETVKESPGRYRQEALDGLVQPSKLESEIWLSAELNASNQNTSYLSTSLIKGGSMPLKGRSPLSWLRSFSRPVPLIQTVDGEEVLFPNLRAIWNDVRDKTLIEAGQIIETRRQEAEAVVSFLGIPIRGHVIVAICPLALLLVGLYLVSHVDLLQHQGTEQSQLLLEYPWVPLFSGWLSRALTVGTLIVLPIVSYILLFARLWYVGSLIILVSIILATASVVCGSLAAWKLVRFNTKLHNSLDQ